MSDLIERLRSPANHGCGIGLSALLDEAADRIAALEAEASEGERRGLERAAEVADDHAKAWGAAQSTPAIAIAAAIRALIPEAPAREGNPKDDPRYPALLADAKARVRNENLDGSPRRHAFTPPQDHREG